MKINKVRFKNINSLRGEHTVDFATAPLKGAGLFAITGPTGSGKTTLLDVICLALFSRVPRISKPITKSVVADTGAILTRNTQECYAEVEYECKKGIFRSKWEISTARTGNLRDYDMFVSELPNDKIIDAKKSEVPSINEGNIGLHFDQFVKSMMLAQGDFAKFLQSGADGIICREPVPHKMSCDRTKFAFPVFAGRRTVKIDFDLLFVDAAKLPQDGDQLHFVIKCVEAKSHAGDEVVSVNDVGHG